MEFEQFELSNGMRVVHQRVNSPAAHCAFIVNAGTRHEPHPLNGLAHLLEHCIFKGTVKRKPYHILNRMDAVGAELNAYTSKEDTAIHASFLPQHFERAIELLSDILFHSTYPEKEIEKEKEVVRDEILSYQDSPAEQIFDDFEEFIFNNHPLGRSILGNTGSLKQIDRADLIQFTTDYYHPENMVFASVGNISSLKVKNLLEKYVPTHVKPFTHSTSKTKLPYSPSQKIIQREVFQAHGMIGGPAYAYDSLARRPFILLNNLLGGPSMNNRLNLNISEKYGFAYNLESNYQSYSDAGLFSVYLGVDEQHLERGIELICKELKKLRDKPLGVRQLHQAKEQLKGQIALSQESGGNLMIALGKSLLTMNRIDTLRSIYKEIDTISAISLQELANEVFNPNELSTFVFRKNHD